MRGRAGETKDREGVEREEGRGKKGNGDRKKEGRRRGEERKKRERARERERERGGLRSVVRRGAYPRSEKIGGRL